MKNFKKSIRFLQILIFLLLIHSASILAQRGPQERGASHLDQMKTELQLSDEQVAKIEALNQKYHEKMKALQGQKTDNFQEKRGQMQDLRAEHRKEVAAVLTPEQQQKMESLRQKRREEMQKSREARRDRPSKADREALKTEMENYKTKNIRPVLADQRAKLEKTISAEDKTAIEGLRVKFAEFQSARKEKSKEIKRDRKKTGPPSKDSGRHSAQHEAVKALVEANEENVEALKALVEKYDPEITALLKEIEPQQEKWQSDMKAIKEKYLKEEGREDRRQYNPSMRRGHRYGHKGQGLSSSKMIHKGQFLLLDPDEVTVVQPSATYSDIKVYPTPAFDSNKIEFEVKEAGRIRIDIIDNAGKVIREVSNEMREPGVYTVEVDLSNLKGTVFYYRITDKNGVVSSKKFMVTRE